MIKRREALPQGRARCFGVASTVVLTGAQSRKDRARMLDTLRLLRQRARAHAPQRRASGQRPRAVHVVARMETMEVWFAQKWQEWEL